MTRVKICGIKSVEDGLVALESGASFLGFVFYPPSHRFIEPSPAAKTIAALRAARPNGWQAVGVEVNIPLHEMNAIVDQCQFDFVQVCGEEDADYCRRLHCPVIRAVRVGAGEPVTADLLDPARYGATRVLVDAHKDGMYGGTGQAFDWSSVSSLMHEAILSGGLDPFNVGRAIEAAEPWGVDVSSGVERNARKDHTLIRAFLSQVRLADGIAV